MLINSWNYYLDDGKKKGSAIRIGCGKTIRVIMFSLSHGTTFVVLTTHLCVSICHVKNGHNKSFLLWHDGAQRR